MVLHSSPPKYMYKPSINLSSCSLLCQGMERSCCNGGKSCVTANLYVSLHRTQMSWYLPEASCTRLLPIAGAHAWNLRKSVVQWQARIRKLCLQAWTLRLTMMQNTNRSVSSGCAQKLQPRHTTHLQQCACMLASKSHLLRKRKCFAVHDVLSMMPGI